LGKRWPPHRPDHHQIPAAVLAQGGKDPAGSADPQNAMGPGRENVRFGGVLEPDDENIASRGVSSRGNLRRKRSAAGDNPQRALGRYGAQLLNSWHFCRIFHYIFCTKKTLLASGLLASA
jgi:hypothetical protein